MRKEIIETGKSVDAAIESACEKLGCDRENCNWEILDLPKKSFLGLKVVPAKVRVSIEVPDEPVKQAEKVAELPKKPVAKVQTTEAVTQKAENPPRRDDDEEVQRILVEDGFSIKEQTALTYIGDIIREFGLKAKLTLYREGNGICIDIIGDGLGTIIGRRGETLDAIQYLTGLVVNRLEGDYLRVTVDCGDYRTKRKDTLEALAKKLASQVLKTNVSKTLEPMNPFERRVIHATVSKIDGVSSSSIGDEPNRRVVITSPTARRPSRGYGGRGSRDGGGDRRSAGGRGGYSRDRSDRRGSGGSDRDRGRGDRDNRRPPRSGGPRPGGGMRNTPPHQNDGPPKKTPEAEAIGNAPYGKLDLD